MRRLIIIDVSNFIFRAFFAIRPLTAPDGTPVNAVYGVLTMLHRLIQDMKPTHVAVARDTKEKSIRTEIYADYKANRTAPPDDLVPQFALIEELLDRLRLPSMAMPGHEADDIIGSLIEQYKDQFDEILIASGDKDLMQFVDDKVKMLDTMKGKTYGPDDVVEKMGVPPHQIVDYLSLIGDSSDNIPGVPGIGPKGASALLKEFGTLEECLKNADKAKGKKTQSALKEFADQARLSKELATIKCDLELALKPKDLNYTFKADPELAAFLDRLGFKSFLTKIGAAASGSDETGETETEQPSIQDDRKIREFSSESDLRKFVQKGKGSLFLFPMWRTEGDLFSPLDKLAITHEEGHAIWTPDAETAGWRVIQESQRPIVCWELKPVWLRFLRAKLPLPQDGDDLAQIHFVLVPDGRHDLDTVSRELTGEGLLDISTGQGDLLESKVSPEALIGRSKVLEMAHQGLLKKLKEIGVERPYRELDLPLLRVLASMELAGITLDVPFYANLEKEFDTLAKSIEKEVETIAGHEVNLKSPKQLAHVLFGELSLPVIKKTKTGYSTDVDVLEQLALMNLSPIPEMLLKYREVEKLNSTYVRSLPKMISTIDNRIHTTYRPGNAATGRLSSDHPNLQNIPVRTENGKRLRRGFVASPGKVLISADYSQVELRILAHFAEDPVMLDAFENDKDIHLQTAAEVFGLKLDQVTKEQRNSAKAINFGLMYGQTSFGLSQTLGINQGEAKDYITKYFQRFGRVKGYLDSLKEFAEKNGYAETMFGRKRFVPDINSSNRQIKAMAERIAINSPIQGTAADIIKLAMIQLQEELQKNYKGRLLLQVHDELILEAPPEEKDALLVLVREKMEGAVKLKTRLKVDISSGSNWYELK